MKTEQQPLLARTVQLLQDRPEDLTILKIQEATGLPFHWLTKMAANQIPNPSVNRVQRLYEYLAGKPIRLPV